MEKVEDVCCEKSVKARQIVNKYIWWAAGAGVLPVAGVDMLAVSGVQIKMLSKLAAHYEIEFSKEWGKSLIAALIGGIAADQLTRSFLTSMVKTVPIVGFVGHLSMPIYSSALTYAVGKVFIQHFESGGTFLDFDPEKVKEYFSAMFAEGKDKATKAAK